MALFDEDWKIRMSAEINAAAEEHLLSIAPAHTEEKIFVIAAERHQHVMLDAVLAQGGIDTEEYMSGYIFHEEETPDEILTVIGWHTPTRVLIIINSIREETALLGVAEYISSYYPTILLLSPQDVNNGETFFLLASWEDVKGGLVKLFCLDDLEGLVKYIQGITHQYLM